MTRHSSAQVRRLVLNLLDGDQARADALFAGSAIGVTDWARSTGAPVPELQTEGFFAMAFPCDFVNGSCDPTVPRVQRVDFAAACEHLLWAGDGRIGRNPVLKLFLTHLHMKVRRPPRRCRARAPAVAAHVSAVSSPALAAASLVTAPAAALSCAIPVVPIQSVAPYPCVQVKANSQAGFVISQQLNDACKTVPELVEALRAGDESVPRKILSVGANLVNTPPYWRAEHVKVRSFQIWKRATEGESFDYFQTLSMAEFHWPQMKRLLLLFVTETRGAEQAERLAQRDARQLLLELSHVVVVYFDARTVNYWATVLREVLEYDDAWWRHEFAKGRGAAHLHGLAASKKHHRIVRARLGAEVTSLFGEDSEERRDAAVDNLWRWMSDAEGAAGGESGPGFACGHPTAPEPTVGVEARKDQEVVGVLKTTLLPTYAGDGAAVATRGLRYARLQRRVGDHACTLTCLGPLRRCRPPRQPAGTTAAAGGNHARQRFRKRKCRFGFGEYDEEHKQAAGREAHGIPLILGGPEHPRVEGRRTEENAYFIQKVKVVLETAASNADTQLIVEAQLEKLDRSASRPT